MVKALLLTLLATAFIAAVVEAQSGPVTSCCEYNDDMEAVRSGFEAQNLRNKNLEADGYVIPDNIFGAFPTYDTCAVTDGNIAALHTYAAGIFRGNYSTSECQYRSLAKSCGQNEHPKCCTFTPGKAPKYRRFDGRGNNFNNPEYGAANTPFARVAPKGYADGISTPRRAKSGNPLPNPRDLVQKVLLNLTRNSVDMSKPVYNCFALATVLFITHDAHYQSPVQPKNASQEIQCCLKDKSGTLSADKSNSACFPIPISSTDPVYGPANITCLPLVRSERGEYPSEVQAGEIMNRATSFLDCSLIYGVSKCECDSVRKFYGGLLQMDKYGVLPVTKDGTYAPFMARFSMAPFSSVWPALYAQNHNLMANGLAELNPCWGDEKLFQEARRLNIATFQFNLITSKAVEDSISGIPINENYNSSRNAACSAEFAIAYRFAHYYLQDYLSFVEANGTRTQMKQSDTIGKFYLIQKFFFQILRGLLADVVNAGVYGYEVTNQIGKETEAGPGQDLIATDIQRSRDQGLGSYTAVRDALGLPPVRNWTDLITLNLMNEHNVGLLQDIYEDVCDMDYYLGGAVETMDCLGNVLVGKTFGAVIARQWDNFAGGDAYYYTNPDSPYPFTADQISAIQKYTMSNMICALTGWNETCAGWPYIPYPGVMPIISCDAFPPMNLTAWIDDPCCNDVGPCESCQYGCDSGCGSYQSGCGSSQSGY